MPIKKEGSQWYLFWVSLVAALGGFLFGFDTAVISGTVSFVKEKFVLDTVMEGWFVSSALLGCIIGVAFAGYLSDAFGRKKVLFLAAILFAVSAIGCTLSITNFWLIIFRLIGGLGVGVASMLSPLYISEISSPNLRGRMVALYQFAITIGILCAYFSNATLLNISTKMSSAEYSGLFNWIIRDEVWRSMFGAETIPAIIFFGLLFLVPQSPRWLTANGRPEIAEKILARVSGQKAAEQEMIEIKETLARESGSLKELWKPGFRLALFIGISLAVLSQFTGINAIIYYGPKIFASAGLGVGDSLNSQVIIGVINVLFTIIALWKIDTFGRRPLLLTGAAAMMIFLTLIGLFFFLNVANPVWLLIFMLAYCACFSFSFGPVVWTILAEIYPTHIRGRAMSIATFVLWIAVFIIGQMVPWMLENIGPSFTFWIFGIMCLPAIFITWKLVPETKGKTLEQIEKMWMR